MKTASEARNGRPSLKITQGVERAPNRSMLRGGGFADGDFDKPIVGVDNAYSTITPCNMGLNDLAVRAGEALREMGAMPQVFGTITVSDGISMGTEGMRYSLVSREVIADSIHTLAAAHGFDGISDDLSRHQPVAHALGAHGNADAHGDGAENLRHRAQLPQRFTRTDREIVETHVARGNGAVSVGNADNGLVKIAVGKPDRAQHRPVGSAFHSLRDLQARPAIPCLARRLHPLNSPQVLVNIIL